MNKTELIKKVAAENGLTQKDAAGVVDSVLNSIMDSLAARTAPSPADTATPARAATPPPARP